MATLVLTVVGKDRPGLVVHDALDDAGRGLGLPPADGRAHQHEKNPRGKHSLQHAPPPSVVLGVLLCHTMVVNLPQRCHGLASPIRAQES